MCVGRTPLGNTESMKWSVVRVALVADLRAKVSGLMASPIHTQTSEQPALNILVPAARPGSSFELLEEDQGVVKAIAQFKQHNMLQLPVNMHVAFTTALSAVWSACPSSGDKVPVETMATYLAEALEKQINSAWISVWYDIVRSYIGKLQADEKLPKPASLATTTLAECERLWHRGPEVHMLR